MYFTWKNTPYGIIRISCDGLKNFADDMLKSRMHLYSITLTPSGKKEHADMTIVISDEELQPSTKKQVENHFAEVLKPMGMKPLIVWASPERGVMPVLQSPYTWAVVAACSAVIITAGFEGFFWTAFWGASAWFGVFGLGRIARKLGRVQHGR